MGVEFSVGPLPALLCCAIDFATPSKLKRDFFIEIIQ